MSKARAIDGPGPPLEIVAATAQHWDSLAELFGTARVMRECWCQWPRRARGMHRPDAVGNRERMKALVDSGEPPGLIALAAGRPVAWCALGPCRAYPQYAGEHADDVWAIACLFVAERARGSGVARQLVEAAVAHARERGAGAVLGPPPWWLPDGVDAAATVEKVFRACGFEPIDAGTRMPLLCRF